MNKQVIKSLHQLGVVDDFDIRFSDFMERLSGNAESMELYLASVLLNHTLTGEKHICLDLPACGGKKIEDVFSDIPEKEKKRFHSYVTPSPDAWVKALKKHPVVGLEGEYAPFVLDERNNRLYLYRYWDYERKLSEGIKKRLLKKRAEIDTKTLKAVFSTYFSSKETTTPDWQKVAVYAALSGSFCVISGGPGTGKTYTVTNLMALLLEQDRHLRISICAPTGKAAARLQESILQAKSKLHCSPQILEKIPEQAATLHRLLGVRKNSASFVHHAENPLTGDVFIVDEASMVSLPLLSKFVQALPENARLILLGDKHQLSSVEAGSVFGDICDAGGATTFSEAFGKGYAVVTGRKFPTEHLKKTCRTIEDSIVELTYSHRFDDASAIGKLSRAVKAGEPETALAVLEEEHGGVLKTLPLPVSEKFDQELERIVSDHIREMFRAPDVSSAFDIFRKFQILCANRNGKNSVASVNAAIETILKKKYHVPVNDWLYKGKPIIILENDYHLKLYNGDIGIIWKEADESFRAYFPDSQNIKGGVLPSRLPKNDTVYAMTIHKSQGSEFENILMILPDTLSPILTRELVYTGITRAKTHVEIWTDKDIFKNAIRARVARRSGLTERLQEA